MAAYAQIESDVTVNADIPYAFTVMDRTLPAGKYTIKVLDSDEPNVLEISSADGRTSVLVNTEDTQSARTPDKTKLVFDKVGDQYFLSQVWIAGDESGSQLVKTKMEQRLENSGANREQLSVNAQRGDARQ
jgi:hypothetical protein